ncbi:MAG: hypothetical protein IIU47_07940, partial [Lachnospiraceae bacterium]|nr:hypothetical protein [Lachnospiraceae bacterium]
GEDRRICLRMRAGRRWRKICQGRLPALFPDPSGIFFLSQNPLGLLKKSFYFHIFCAIISKAVGF